MPPRPTSSPGSSERRRGRGRSVTRLLHEFNFANNSPRGSRGSYKPCARVLVGPLSICPPPRAPIAPAKPPRAPRGVTIETIVNLLVAKMLRTHCIVRVVRNLRVHESLLLALRLASHTLVARKCFARCPTVGVLAVSGLRVLSTN